MRLTCRFSVNTVDRSLVFNPLDDGGLRLLRGLRFRGPQKHPSVWQQRLLFGLVSRATGGVNQASLTEPSLNYRFDDVTPTHSRTFHHPSPAASPTGGGTSAYPSSGSGRSLGQRVYGNKPEGINYSSELAEISYVPVWLLDNGAVNKTGIRR